MLKGGDSLSALAAGLPNITGKIQFYGNRGGVQKQEGAFYPTKTINNTVPAADQSLEGFGKDEDIIFDASRSSNIYGASDTVQPPAIVLLPQIRY